MLHVSVTGQDGHFIANIPESAFKIYENGVEQITKFFHAEETPVSVGLVIDSSASMRSKRANVITASMILVNAFNQKDEMFVVTFSEAAFLDQPLTVDKKELEDALAKANPRGITAMRDAVNMSIDYVKSAGKNEKKALVVITDGEDNASNVTLEQLVRKTRQSGVTIYNVGLLDAEEPRAAGAARRALQALAGASGGIFYDAKDLGQLDQITTEVAGEIWMHYLLGYSPTGPVPAGAGRKTNVVVSGFGQPVVRTRQVAPERPPQ
jgi:VWFA-related protein